MGVPGLLGNLRPYSQSETWDRRETPRARAIIDGPALAYHVYYKCLAQNQNASNALDAVPDYKSLCDATLNFLHLLRQHGLEIHRIFFDGALPNSKTETRMGRLQRSVDEMRGFRSLNPILQRTHREHVKDTSFKIFTDPTAVASSRLKSVPVAPFIVPAIRDCLSQSRYAQTVEVVPFEADIACTSPALCQPSDIILTSDSDLFLQMPRARISFFRDMTFSESSMALHLYDCHGIAKRLDIPNDRIALMGYHLQQDSHCALTECAKRARKGLGLKELAFDEFRTQYHPWAKQDDWLDTFSSGCYTGLDLSVPEIGEAVQSMDPRILEAIVSAGQDNHIRLFLPPLLEDPTRSTAWLPGTSIRLAAFKLWALATNKNGSHDLVLEEYTRHGLKVTCRSSIINRASLSKLDQELNPTYDRISLLSKQFSHVPEADAWVFITLITFLGEADRHDLLPDRKDVARLVANTQEPSSKGSRVLGWSQVQLNAQLEAWYYSMRILGQLCKLASVASPKSKKLQKYSLDIPHLQHVMRTPMLGMDFSHAGELLNANLSIFYPEFDAQKDAQEAPKESKAARKKRKAAHAAERKPGKSPKLTGNMFDVLAEDS